MTVNSDETTTHAGAVSATHQASEENWQRQKGFSQQHDLSISSEQATSNLFSEKLGHISGEGCKHCGRLSMSGEFCCNGCQAAFHFINGLGLDYFYKLRQSDRSLEMARAAESSSSFHYYDDPSFFEKFIRTNTEGVSKLRLHLPGIHCAACIWLLEKLPEILPGVAEARVDLAQATVRVSFERGICSASQIAQTISGFGYQPHPIAIDETPSAESSSDHRLALQLGVAGFCAMNIMLLATSRYAGLFTGIETLYGRFFAWISLALSLPVILFAARPFFQTSIAALRMKRLHIDLPIAVAIIAGYTASVVNTVLGRSEIYFDTVTALVFLLLVGRWFQARAMKRVAKASDLLYSLLPLSARKIQVDGSIDEVFVESLQLGDSVLIEPEGRIVCDGIVIAGTGATNNSLLTGESRPLPVSEGSQLWAGTKNCGTELVLQVKAKGKGTRLGKLMSEIEQAPRRGSRIARFVDRISVYFVVGVFFIAGVTFILTLPLGFWQAWDRVIALLVVSCPCALGIATPITLAIAGARSARHGILLKDGEALERLARIDKVIFDKTGTLTQVDLEILRVELFDPDFNLEKLWQVVVALESEVEHPVARALLVNAKKCKAEKLNLKDRRIIPGKGVQGIDSDGKLFQIGSLSFLSSEGVIGTDLGNSLVGISIERKLVAIIELGDRLRLEAKSVIEDLNKLGISSAIVSGDDSEVVQVIGERLGIDSKNAKGNLTPEEKAKIVVSEKESAVFVGDGVNDGLAISQAGVGIGIAGGAEICLKVSDIYFLQPNLRYLIDAIKCAKSTVKLIHRHLKISLAYNIIAAALAISGEIGPLLAALVMPLSSLSVVLSSVWAEPFGEDLK